MITQHDLPRLDLRIEEGKVCILSDFHIPYHDEAAIDAAFKYIQDTQPSTVILNGDVLDFYKLSRFMKEDAKRDPEEEISIANKILQDLRNIVPNSEIYYIIGNHETRLENYTIGNAPALFKIVPSIFKLIKCRDLNIFGCGALTINDTFICEHGKLLGNKSGLSAIKELEAHYMNGATGHTHRLAKFITRKAGKKFVWFETGCLCSLNPNYMINPDWQQGFVVLEYKNGKLKRGVCKEIEDGEIL